MEIILKKKEFLKQLGDALNGERSDKGLRKRSNLRLKILLFFLNRAP